MPELWALRALWVHKVFKVYRVLLERSVQQARRAQLEPRGLLVQPEPKVRQEQLALTGLMGITALTAQSVQQARRAQLVQPEPKVQPEQQAWPAPQVQPVSDFRVRLDRWVLPVQRVVRKV